MDHHVIIEKLCSCAKREGMAQIEIFYAKSAAISLFFLPLRYVPLFDGICFINIKSHIYPYFMVFCILQFNLFLQNNKL